MEGIKFVDSMKKTRDLNVIRERLAREIRMLELSLDGKGRRAKKKIRCKIAETRKRLIGYNQNILHGNRPHKSKHSVIKKINNSDIIRITKVG